MSDWHIAIELVVMSGALMIVLLKLARRRISSPADRMKLRAAAWSLLSDTPATANDGRTRAQENKRVKGGA